jgi:hypothetical protein
VHGNFRSAQSRRLVFAALLAYALSGCAGLSDVASGDVKVFNTGRWFSKPTWTSITSNSAAARREVTQNDLLGPDGACAGMSVVAPEPAGGDPTALPTAAPLIPGGIGIDMTECEVVQRAGRPDNFELGNNQRGERSMVLTYIHGPKPGIYKFEAGRLVAMERGPEPPAAPKPAKPAKQPAKPGPSARRV